MFNLFKSQNPPYEHLRKKWTSKHTEKAQNLIDKHLKNVALSSLGGLMLLQTPGLSVPVTPTTADSAVKISGTKSKNALLATELTDKVPTEMRALTPQEDATITSLIEKDLGIPVKAEIDNKRLNRTYGVIGGEQHLYRYPGDTVQAHAKTAEDWAMFGSSGIAPGLGAWGYFAPSKAEFTKEDEDRERWYIAVQTFLSPGFSERVAEYRDFYKYRKMLVVNPKTGQAVVAVIGDAGPGQSTGKHLGGSPEVMHELGVASGPRKGPMLYYFVDDPKNEIPLGPVKLSGDLIET